MERGMCLVERDVDGLSCKTMLAPQGWVQCVHHDVRDKCSVNVTHFTSLDSLSTSLYVTEYFLPRPTSVESGSSAGVTPEALAASLAQLLDPSKFSLCTAWEVPQSAPTESCGPLGKLLCKYVLLVSVALSTRERDATYAGCSFDAVVYDLKERYLQLSRGSDVVGLSSTEWVAGNSAVCTRRGCCVIHVTAPPGRNICWHPQLGGEATCKLGEAAKELGLVSENLNFLLYEDAAGSVEVMFALLPLTPGVCIMKRGDLQRAWLRRTRGSRWRSLRLPTPGLTTGVVDPCNSLYDVRPPGSFYLLVRGEGGTARSVIAWLMEPRVGSDSSIVLLTTFHTARGGAVSTTASVVATDAAITVDTAAVDPATAAQCLKHCKWLRSTFCVSVGMTFSWSALCVGKRPGLLFRQGNLVIQLPSESTRYASASAVAAASAVSRGNESAALGSITVEAVDRADGTERRATITLLREFRCAIDFMDYVVTEFTYEAHVDRRSAVMRRCKAPLALLPGGGQGTGKRPEAYSFWIRLGERDAIHYVVRECGIGHLLLAQACVTDCSPFSDVVAERWESWVGGIGVASIL